MAAGARATNAGSVMAKAETQQRLVFRCSINGFLFSMLGLLQAEASFQKQNFGGDNRCRLSQIVLRVTQPTVSNGVRQGTELTETINYNISAVLCQYCD